VIAGIRELRKGQVWVASLQELHQNGSKRTVGSGQPAERVGSADLRL